MCLCNESEIALNMCKKLNVPSLRRSSSSWNFDSRNEVIRLQRCMFMLLPLLFPFAHPCSPFLVFSLVSLAHKHKAGDALTPCAVERENKREGRRVESLIIQFCRDEAFVLNWTDSLYVRSFVSRAFVHNDFTSSWMPDRLEYVFVMDIFSRASECTSLPSHCAAARYWFHYLQTACLCRYVNRNPDCAAWMGNCQSDQTVAARAFVQTVLYLEAEAITPFYLMYHDTFFFFLPACLSRSFPRPRAVATVLCA